jgi:glycosyltransferase involved in cell wall biosynthesis
MDAACFMATEILPLLRLQRPGTLLRVVGRISEQGAAALSAIPGVVVAGEVPDVGVAVQGAAVGVCPMRLGAGVQNKVLEYMALGLPTVTTPLGLEGFAARDGKELMVAEDACKFADAVLTLLEDRVAARALALRARRYVEDHHSWAALLAPMVKAISERVDQSAPASRVGPRMSLA